MDGDDEIITLSVNLDRVIIVLVALGLEKHLDLLEHTGGHVAFLNNIRTLSNLMEKFKELGGRMLMRCAMLELFLILNFIILILFNSNPWKDMTEGSMVMNPLEPVFSKLSRLERYI